MTRRNQFHLEIAGDSHVGVIRSCNEDSIAWDKELGLLVLADGMGGYKSGDVASSIATGLVMDYLKPTLEEITPSSVRSAQVSAEALAVKYTLKKTNLAIHKTAQADNKYTGMGTTIVLALFHHDLATIAHVGDSRLYRLRDGKLALLTHDHSLLQQQFEQGLISPEDAKLSHNRNLVSRALGVSGEIRIEISEQQVLNNDIYLLCSDGLNDMVDDADIALALDALQGNLPLCVNQLIQMANDNGGHDNVSVLIAKVQPRSSGWQAVMENIADWLKNLKKAMSWQN